MAKKEEEKVINYDEKFQRLILEFILSSPDAFVRCNNILKPEYFTHTFSRAVKFILKHAEENQVLPHPRDIDVHSDVVFNLIEPEYVTKPQVVEYFLREIEQFCRHKAIELTILSSIGHLEKGDYAPVEKGIKEAMTISLQSDLGMDYFKDPRKRLEEMRDKSNMISTGWKSVDHLLYGGFTRGGLNIFAGASGQGKSLFLQNIMINWAEMGLNCVYISLELSEHLVGHRLDSMVAGLGAKEIFRNLDKVELALGLKSKSMGKMQIKRMKEGSTTNDIRAYLKEYEIQTGIHPDCVIVDYLDIMMPNNNKVNPGDLFVKDKFVSEELRGLAHELNVLLATASQLNRGSIEETSHSMAHIAGGLSKINTADNVMTIYSSKMMKDRGEYQLQFIKTRSSSGVGHSLLLAFNIDTMRITDMPEGYQNGQSGDMNSLVNELKTGRKVVRIDDDTTIDKATGMVEDSPVFDRTKMGNVKTPFQNVAGMMNLADELSR